MFENFLGNTDAAATLRRMIEGERIPQTLLFAGPEGVGKATLARRFGAALLGGAGKIELDDLSLADNVERIESREKLPADKRNEDPLVFASHPDFLTFAPDGPLRELSIGQMRLLKERAQFKPSKGNRRVFLIDRVDRANDQAANSLLKTLEEPPDHLIVILTAQNPYDLLPTIRSRAVPLYFTPLSTEDTRPFLQARGADRIEQRMALAGGSPGVALSLDLDAYERRRAAMLALLGAALDRTAFPAWLQHSEAISRSKPEKLDLYLSVLYQLLRDLLVLRESGGAIRNEDVRPALEALARRVSFAWIRAAVKKVDEIAELVRRNIQKTIALDSMVVELRNPAP